MLRFVPNGAVMEVDGGKPTSRGLPPAAFWETGRWRMRMRWKGTKDGVLRTRKAGHGRTLTVVERETCEHLHSCRIALPEGHKREMDTVIRVEVAEAEMRFEPLGK